jgi:type III secretion protein T
MGEISQYIDLIINIALAGTRMAVAFYTVPFIHRSTVVPMVRNAMVLSFSIPLLPTIISYHLPPQKTMLFILMLIAKEALIGFIIGFLVGIIFWAAQCSGKVIDMQRGAFFAIMPDPLSKTESTPYGSLFFNLATILFFVCGGFREMLGAIIDSYRIWPVDRYFPHIDQNLVDFIARQLIRCLGIVVILAAPIVVSTLTADMALGVLNRFAPQINIFMISLTVKSVIASLIMVLYISFLVRYLKGYFLDSAAILQIVGKVFQ